MDTQSAACLIKQVYRGLSGYDVDDTERQSIQAQGAAPVYGELTFKGVRTLLDNLPVPLSGSDVFYDLGSGNGKVCTQLWLITEVKKSVGIELSPTRHAQAETARQRLLSREPGLAARAQALAFRRADFLSADIADATIVYFLAFSFPDALLDRLFAKLRSECPNLRWILSGKFYQAQPPIRLVKTFRADADFGPHCYINLYTL